MKIGFDAKRFAANTTGLGVYARNLVTSLAQYHPQHALHVFSPVPVRSVWAKNLAQNVTVHAPAQKPNWLRQHRLRNVEPIHHVKTLPLDVFHGLSNSLPPCLPCACVVTIHDLIFLKDTRWHDWLNRQRYRILALRACQQADLILAVSQSVKEDIQSYFAQDASKIWVCYPHVDPSFTSQPQQHFQEVNALGALGLVPQQYWLNVGGAEKRKNPFAVMKAFAQVSQALPTMQLVFTGRSKRVGKQLQVLAKHLGLAERIHFMGYVAQHLLPVLYRHSALCLYLSYVEGFGLPVLEAMQCGALCLVSNHSSMDEVCGSAAYRAPPDDVNAIATALLHLANTPILTKQLRQAIPAHTAQFAPQCCMQQLTQAYQEAIRRWQAKRVF